MFDNEKILIDKLLEGKEYLKSDSMYNRGYLFVKEILSMPEWEEEKFLPVLTSNIWNSNYDEVKKVLSMSEWKEPKFQPLLTSNIWNSNYENIKNILSMSEWKEPKFQSLLTSNIWKSNYDEVKKVLSMSEWNDENFFPLLTSNIWKSSYKEIKQILKFEKINGPIYNHLLIPSIFNLNYRNIVLSIELFEEYNIGKYITCACMRRNVNYQRKLIEYLVNNDYDLLIEKEDGQYKLNPILNASNTDLKKKYGIDIKEISKNGAKKK